VGPARQWLKAKTGGARENKAGGPLAGSAHAGDARGAGLRGGELGRCWRWAARRSGPKPKEMQFFFSLFFSKFSNPFFK
jgi:hypothetical protein